MLRCGRARAVASVSRTLRQFAVMHMATVTEERADVLADQTSGPIGFRSPAFNRGVGISTPDSQVRNRSGSRESAPHYSCRTSENEDSAHCTLRKVRRQRPKYKPANPEVLAGEEGFEPSTF